MAHGTIKYVKFKGMGGPDNLYVASIGTPACPHAVIAGATPPSVQAAGQGERLCMTCSRDESVRFDTAEPVAGPAPVGVIGLSHLTAPSEVRDRVAILPDRIPSFIAEVRATGAVECAVLSTCNRTEIYYAEGEAASIVGLLAKHAGMTVSELGPYLVDKRCVCAACHLFRVVSGLESAVLGETEIVAQVKNAWKVSEECGAAGSGLRVLFQRSLEASKRVRTESDVCRNVTATGTLAVRQAEAHLGGLTGRRIAILGAGKIAERVTQDLADSPHAELKILNRTLARAEALAAQCGATVGGLDELDCELVRADAIIAAVSTDHPIIDAEKLAHALPTRDGRPLVIIDLGAPHNVALNLDLPEVTIIRLDDLKAQSQQNADLRISAMPKALAILDQEVSRYVDSLAERAAAPTIRALIQQSDKIRRQNLKWAHDRLPDLSEAQLKVVEEMARRMMIGLLEAPIAGLKGELSAREHRHVVERLFAIEGGEGEQ